MTMTTETRVERIAVNTDDQGDKATTFYSNDPDLSVSLQRGGLIGTGDVMGAVVVKLRIDDNPIHEVILDAYQRSGTPVEVLDQAIEQLTVARDALQRIQDGEDINRPEMAVEGANR